MKRKYLFTALYECSHCALRFRVPKDAAGTDPLFYEDEYVEGFTTELPDPHSLTQLLETRFAGTEKDYTRYIQLMTSIGLEPGSTVYDFGCSWGYGSWQLREAGYRVQSFEIARNRAEYAAKLLGCSMVESPEMVDEPVDCFFSAHVLEHLADPAVLWRTARATLKPTGKLVLFMPNGEPVLEQADPHGYHQIWGKVHPLLLNAKALSNMARSFGFAGCAFSTPFPTDRMPVESGGPLVGEELAFVAQRCP